ncbi:MAG: Ppx/GppA phosphatase family protein [Polyangiales bacterium]
MRVAAIDIGTNTVLMLIAERLVDGSLFALEEAMEITRLGKGVDRSHRLDDARVRDTLAVLERYRKRAMESGVERVGAVATSASRDAINGDDFRRQAAEILGADVRVVTGDREAALTFAGALGGLDLTTEGRVAVIDVGGGSTEIVVGTIAGGGPAWVHSYDVGSVRLTERHVLSDPPTTDALDAMRTAVVGALREAPPPKGPFACVVAIAGTATTFAAIDQKLATYSDAPPHGYRLTVRRIDELVKSLGSMAATARRTVIGLDPRRADVIVAGGIVLAEMIRALDGNEFIVSDRGVRWGLAMELAQTIPDI